MEESALVPRIRTVYGIDPRSWEHPADKAALGTVKSLKGLDKLVMILVSMIKAMVAPVMGHIMSGHAVYKMHHLDADEHIPQAHPHSPDAALPHNRCTPGMESHEHVFRTDSRGI